MGISTHSPRVGRTASTVIKIRQLKKFQLTRPVWGEPLEPLPRQNSGAISTHSPRVGRTTTEQHTVSRLANFNSLAPCGANRGYFQMRSAQGHFNSLAPCGANHARALTYSFPFAISTHSPRVGRTTAFGKLAEIVAISTHSPRVGRTFLTRSIAA